MYLATNQIEKAFHQNNNLYSQHRMFEGPHQWLSLLVRLIIRA